MNKNTKWITGAVIVIALIAVGYSIFGTKQPTETGPIKIGVISPLTGGVAYWGESSVLGIELAKKDLQKQGVNVEFVIEDGQLDPKIALSAAQKLVNIDKVDAIYSEFNPAAIAVSSFLKDKNILHVYDAVPLTPLKESENNYKTYLDYEKACQKAAQLVKGRGIDKVGVLKMNLEFGDLCLEGIKNVYGDNVVSEEYNVGTSDFRTALLKLKSENIQALFNASWKPETLASIKQANELGIDAVFVGLSEVVSPDIVDEYSNILEGSIMFGLPAVSEEFMARVEKEFPGKTIGNYQAVALAYIHTKQIANALSKCDKDLACARKEMNNAKPESIVGFTGFKSHVAGFDVLIQEWKNGEFVDIQK